MLLSLIQQHEGQALIDCHLALDQVQGFMDQFSSPEAFMEALGMPQSDEV